MIKTVIVEDDLMVASINRQFALRTPGIEIIAAFHNGKDALSFLSRADADLLLLDLYMPECSGLELLSQLRQFNQHTDVIMITAANDAAHISEALHLGIVDYLVKPFQYERFAEAMDKILLRKAVMENGSSFSQSDIDQLIALRRPSEKSREMELQKGLQRHTLERIRGCLKAHPQAFLTSGQISAETGLSKVTVRRYVNFLIEQNEAVSQIEYETGGRPRVEYSLSPFKAPCRT
ncbi:MAG: response regulator [Eubacteriales bacterium]|nr:response regulator [Eubacteriales bacterium]